MKVIDLFNPETEKEKRKKKSGILKLSLAVGENDASSSIIQV